MMERLFFGLLSGGFSLFLASLVLFLLVEHIIFFITLCIGGGMMTLALVLDQVFDPYYKYGAGGSDSFW